MYNPSVCTTGYDDWMNVNLLYLDLRSNQFCFQIYFLIGIFCSAPALREHVQVLNVKDSYDFGETIHFDCEDGFLLEVRA